MTERLTSSSVPVRASGEPQKQLEPQDYALIADAIEDFLGFDITTREQQDRITRWGRSASPSDDGARQDDIRNWAERFPEMIDKVRGWEHRTGLTFFMPVDRDGTTNTIDEVVAWARTARGGRHTFLPMMNERPSCESKYGLCE